MDMFERLRLAVLGILTLLGVTLAVGPVSSTPEQFAIHFLDVGQGDAIFIQTPDGYEVLIDGGASSAVLQQLSSIQSWSDRDIDIVIATHPDTDHVGGLNDVLDGYEVEMIIQTEADSDSPAAVAFKKAVSAEDAIVHFARAGQHIQVGASTTIEILAPASDTSNWESNTASVIVRVTYGNAAFMLTGDAPAEVEDYLTEVYGNDLRSNVLKLGHHGSKTSTSELFLDTVQPEYAVVSASLGNRYGHPDQSVMQRVFSRDIQTFHTGTDGTVTFYSDGKQVWKE
jgi:beta-lactamase superfamily II metal-dependent hydrolase